MFSNLLNVNHYNFNKLHPAGNVGVQIHHINPIKDGEDVRFYLSLQDLNRIGDFFDDKVYPNSRYTSVGGNGISNQAIYKVLIGTSIQDTLDSDLSNDIEIISGDLLNGKATVGVSLVKNSIVLLRPIVNHNNIITNKEAITNLPTFNLNIVVFIIKLIIKK